MRSKLLTIVSLAALALVFSGCDRGRTAMGPNETNVLGIVKHQPSNYSPAPPATFAVHKDEIYTRRNYSGNRTTFLWGLVSVMDY